MFHSKKIKVFFPIVDASLTDGTYYATKSLSMTALPTLERVLETVQLCAYHAVANHLIKDRFSKKVTVGDIQSVLDHIVCCHLVCTRAGGWNHVYVRIA